jgi:preprotein translocase subunit SecA
MRYVEKSILLQTLDHLWREHLVTLDHLRQVIGLRGYAQRDPLNEYKSEAFQLFEAMLSNLREAVTAQLMRVEVVTTPPPEPLPVMQAHHLNADAGSPRRDPNDPSTWGRVGRNEACPCGSGLKYKHCHGKFV